MTDNANETQDETAEVLAKYPAPWTAQHTTGSLAVIKDGNGGLILCTFETFARLIVDAVNYRATRIRIGAEDNFETLAEAEAERKEAVAERDAARAERLELQARVGQLAEQYASAKAERDTARLERDEFLSERDRILVAKNAALAQARARVAELEAQAVRDTQSWAELMHKQERTEWALADAEKKLAEQEAADRWIPVGERLPLPYDDDWVLLCDKHGCIDWGCLDGKGAWRDDDDPLAIEAPTHWRPLPAPPVQAGKEA